jgi:3,5-epimerase/4-reductase
MRIVVLGGGFVGTHLIDFLTQKRLNASLHTNREIRYHDKNELKKFLLLAKPDFVVNCSGYTGSPNVDACEDNKELTTKLNITVPTMMSLLCEELKIKIIHVSSGCIYTGYEKIFNETDTPNFGMYNPAASFYSRTKHCFELATPFFENTTILRIRMPFTSAPESKNYIYKLYKYDNLISLKNSVTSIEDLNNFIIHLIFRKYQNGIINVVNRAPVAAEDVIEILNQNNLVNSNWKIIALQDLNVKANRSNCILTPDKAENLGFTFTDSFEAIEKCVKGIKIALNK